MSRMLKQALKGILTDEEISLLYGGFDIVGDIAVIKIPEALQSRKELIGEALIKNVKTVHTVLAQITPVSGEYRTRDLEVIFGEEKTITIYKEHGCMFKVDLAQAYFSPRLSTERLRIAKLVKPGETVTNLFAGVGAYSIIIAKKVPDVRVYSIDVNKAAYELTIENIKLNKLIDRIIPILGDARKVVIDIKGEASRVLMPLPEQSASYLDVAVSALRPPEGVIHYYTHVYSIRNNDAHIEALKTLNNNPNLKYELISHNIVREVGPRWYQVVLDLKTATS